MPTVRLLHAAILVLALALSGCDARPMEPEAGSTALLVAAGASVNSGSTERQSLPLDLTFDFQCGPETTVQLSVYGYVDMVVHASVDGTGRVHNSLHLSPHVYAVDNSGHTYRGGYSRLNLTTRGSDGSLNHTQMIRLIGQGKTPNLHLHLVEQQTVNGQGEISVDFEKSRVTCSS
jgi:hypothetical protein